MLISRKCCIYLLYFLCMYMKLLTIDLNKLNYIFLEKVVSQKIIRKWLINRMKEKQMKIQKEEIEPNLNLLNEIKNYTKTMNKI